MNPAIRTKLSVMMFLEYVIYGAWLPLLGLYIGDKYLHFNGDEQAWIINAFAIASLTGMVVRRAARRSLLRQERSSWRSVT